MSKAAGLALLLVACVGAAASGSSPADQGPLGRAFEASAAGAGVPRDLLVAIAHVEDGLAMPAHRSVHPDAAVPAAGPLMLRRGRLDTLARAASLSGRTEIELRENANVALEAGAKVLASLPHGDDLASWSAALEEMSGYADDAHRTAYAHRVFATLARGGSFEGRDGETIQLPAHDLPPSLTTTIDTRLHTLAQPQYEGAEWIPTSCTNKCNADRGGASVQFIVIHDTEGGWDASVSTLQNDSGKSVQYIVGQDGRVAQFVTEETLAWHAGNSWYNARSVGIEHVGYMNKPFPAAQYAASAELVDYLATKYSVPRDRAHVIGHDQIPDGTQMASSSAPCSDSPKQCTASGKYGGASNHDDPGVWEWAGYMARIGGEAKCNDVTSVLNCSNDKTRAFRCKGGKVEVLTCASACVVESNGVDDLCPQAAAPPPPPPPTSEQTSGTITPEPPSAPPAEPAAAEPQDEGGCSSSPMRRAGGPSGRTGAFLLLAFSWLFLRRKR